MRGEEDHPFTPGTEVIVQRNYSHYGPGTFMTDKVLKVHKTGRFTLERTPSEQWYASRPAYDPALGWTAYPTSRHQAMSIYSTRLRFADAAAKAEMEEAKQLTNHQARCRAIAAAFGAPEKIPRGLSQNVADMLKALEQEGPQADANPR